MTEKQAYYYILCLRDAGELHTKSFRFRDDLITYLAEDSLGEDIWWARDHVIALDCSTNESWTIEMSEIDAGVEEKKKEWEEQKKDEAALSHQSNYI